MVEFSANMEACAAEIMMARYSYAFSFMLDALPHLTFFYHNIAYTFNPAGKYAEQDKLLKEIDRTIENFQTGLQPMHRLSKLISDV